MLNTQTYLTKSDGFLLIPLFHAKKTFCPPNYAIYNIFSQNNHISPSFRGKCKQILCCTSFSPRELFRAFHALSQSTTRCPCSPSHSNWICCKELTLSCLRGAVSGHEGAGSDSIPTLTAFSDMCRGSSRVLKNCLQMVQIEFWKISNFYCWNRKGETAWEYSREKGLVKMTPGKFWDKQGTSQGASAWEVLPYAAPCCPHWGMRGSWPNISLWQGLSSLLKELNICDTKRCFKLGNICKCCPRGGRCAPWPLGTIQLCMPVFFDSLKTAI